MHIRPDVGCHYFQNIMKLTLHPAGFGCWYPAGYTFIFETVWWLTLHPAGCYRHTAGCACCHLSKTAQQREKDQISIWLPSGSTFLWYVSVRILLVWSRSRFLLFCFWFVVWSFCLGFSFVFLFFLFFCFGSWLQGFGEIQRQKANPLQTAYTPPFIIRRSLGFYCCKFGLWKVPWKESIGHKFGNCFIWVRSGRIWMISGRIWSMSGRIWVISGRMFVPKAFWIWSPAGF